MFKIHNARAGRWQLHLKPKRVIGNTILCSFFLEYEQNKLHFENYCYFFFNIFTKVIQYRHLGHFIPLDSGKASERKTYHTKPCRFSGNVPYNSTRGKQNNKD